MDLVDRVKEHKLSREEMAALAVEKGMTPARSRRLSRPRMEAWLIARLQGATLRVAKEAAPDSEVTRPKPQIHVPPVPKTGTVSVTVDGRDNGLIYDDDGTPVWYHAPRGREPFYEKTRQEVGEFIARTTRAESISFRRVR